MVLFVNQGNEIMNSHTNGMFRIYKEAEYLKFDFLFLMLKKNKAVLFFSDILLTLSAYS